VALYGDVTAFEAEEEARITAENARYSKARHSFSRAPRCNSLSLISRFASFLALAVSPRA
jgi:hypothetical protein